MTDAVCTTCPTGTFAFSPTSTSCDGILIKDLRIKQFDAATKKFPVWKQVPAGQMSNFEESMYAEEAVISFQMPTDDWTEIRVYCSKGDNDLRCDTGTNGVDTYEERDDDSGYYFVCTKTDIYDATRGCECNGVAEFAASGSHEDCGPWDGLNQCLVQDGNCKDPITGNAPVHVVVGGKDRWKSQCTPDDPRDSTRKCYADPASYDNIYVRLPGLNEGREEYKFKIVPKHSTAVS